MNIETINFTQEASRRVYTDYMKRIRKATKSLSIINQDDLYMEFNSHIFESIKCTIGPKEMDVLLDVLERLGDPEEFLKPLVADIKLRQATKTFNPVHVLDALILNFTNGVSFIIFFFLYVILLGSIFLIPAEIIYPAQIGIWYKENSFVFLGWSDKPEQKRELLGNWFIPVMLVAIPAFYILITFLLKLKNQSIIKISKN